VYESGAFVPPGWPQRVLPPGNDGWEQSAVEFLIDCCPPILQEVGLPRRQPVVLAYLVEGWVEGQRATSLDLLARLRASLSPLLEPEVVAGAVDSVHAVEARLARVRREVGLVAGALRGVVYRPRL
jgi:hypothetical protein